MQKVILASSSPNRRALLARLGLPFACISPDIDENPLPHEPAAQLVARLAQEKAQKVAASNPNALIIGADQVATLNGQILVKPGNHANAVEQLTLQSGQRVAFYTGLCVLNAKTGNIQVCREPFFVTFRDLSPSTIENYLRREQPYACAGSIRAENLGIALFASTHGEDINALIGLPLIRLVSMLKQEGINVV